ncbi:MAG: hypothetical protein U5N55_06050 [Cypionkella sp.]|nr:hypothetical protein [Cypionkella sp.]
MADEVNILKEKQREYLDQLKVNEQLRQSMSTADVTITALQNNINSLEDDLRDAHEKKEEQIQEDFVQALMYATSEIEKLHNTYTHIFTHLKEHNLLVEDELFDALEREEEQKEMQAQLVSEHQMEMKNVNGLLLEVTGTKELLREEYLMGKVDMFKQCCQYFKNIHSQTMALMAIDHALVWTC